MSESEWEPALDAFERSLAQRWGAFEEGAPDRVGPFEPPAVSTPVPDDLRDRAVALVQRCRALEEALASTLRRVSEQQLELADTKRGPQTGPAEPVYFDSRV